MTFTMSSCQEKKEVLPTSNGRLSVRFVAKNGETNQPFIAYRNVSVYATNPAGGATSTNPASITIMGNEDDRNKFLTSVNILSGDNFRTTLPKYEALVNYGVACSVGGVATLFSLPNNSLDEGLIITKNDADSLVGTFRVRLEDAPQDMSASYKEMEGYFCIAKKGIL